jgi:hypothetical protein
MKVLILEDVINLGLAGDVVTVADGYGRNYLIPLGLAKVATPGALKQADQIRTAGERKRSRQLASAQDLAQRIEGLTPSPLQLVLEKQVSSTVLSPRLNWLRQLNVNWVKNSTGARSSATRCVNSANTLSKFD